jgi:hypothetical protein
MLSEEERVAGKNAATNGYFRKRRSLWLRVRVERIQRGAFLQ